MDSLFDLLANRDLDEPPEMRLIKDYVNKHFKESVGVTAHDREVIITVRSSALAGALRTHTPQLQALLDDTTKRLIFRVGKR
jgi:hypothetical protein